MIAMKKCKVSPGKTSALALAISCVLAVETGRAQDEPPAGIEEVLAVGRLQSAAESLTMERMTLPVSADFLGAEAIARAGDPDIASALRRVPGLTLIDGKFVYVRGLGERYTSVLVNGGAVPSPDLTRSVIPLDLFPTSIVESIKIQKSPSPDALAAFGGGLIDVRTTSVPESAVAELSFGLGFNSVSDGDGLTYPGGATGLPQAIQQAAGTYRGNIGVSNILATLRASAPATITEAAAIHQNLIDSLDTRVGIGPSSLDPDLGVKLALGNTWHFADDTWRFGVLFNGTYNEQYRNEDQLREGIGSPQTNFVDVERTIYEERTLGALNLGFGYLDDHTIEISSYVLRNDEDVAGISRGFDSNIRFPDQKVSYETRLEKRELELTQISGDHTFLDTPALTSFLERRGFEELAFRWFYSESTATTDIPNETRFQAQSLLDPSTGAELSTQLLATTNSGQFSFLALEDRMDSWGGNLSLPLDLDRMTLTVSGGWWGSQKARDYAQSVVNLNAVGIQSTVLAGGPGDVLAPGNLTTANGFNISLGSNFGTESYIAAQKVDAGYAMVDLDFQRWRLMVGARAETYQQTVLPVDLLDFTGVSLIALQNALLDPNQRLAVQEDAVFSSTAFTLNGSGWLGSEDSQLRISYGESIVRPDLREVADVIYLDPELDIRVQGNPSLTSSPIDNFEVRSEFYYDGGSNFTVSLFYKDIQSPIDQVRLAGSDDDFVLGFANAESGEVYGIELEGLKTLPRGLFIAGNVTLSDSEITLNPSLATILTNRTRRLTGHSEWVFNATLGYDSGNGRHSAYLNYNAFGERIFFAGTGQHDDAYEQPFDSLGIVYKYFPTDRLQVEFELDNILDEERQFEQINSNGQVARILQQKVGTNLGVAARWSF
jgi:outer membrane receptor protein involved in Fe transport